MLRIAVATAPPTIAGVHQPASSPTRALILATVAFAACFYASSLLGPLGPDLQDHLGLSEFELALMVAVPVLLGSLMRVPLGILSDRYGGRLVFSALLLFTPLPLVALALWHDSFVGVVALGFLLGFAGASFAVGVPFVNRWFAPERQGAALGVYGMGMIGSVAAGFTGPKIVKAWGLAAPFWIATGVIVTTGLVFLLLARDAPAPAGPRPRMLGSLDIFRSSGRAWALTLFYFLSFGGFVAMFLYLPKLLTGVHHLTKPEAGARAAVFLGLGTGAVFKLVPLWFPANVGAVTGVVGAAGGLGGFFPPLVMGIVKSATGGYGLGFVLLAGAAVACLLVLAALARAPVARPAAPA